MEFARRESGEGWVGMAIWEARHRTLRWCDAGKILDRAPAKFRDSDAQGSLGQWGWFQFPPVDGDGWG